MTANTALFIYKEITNKSVGGDVAGHRIVHDIGRDYVEAPEYFLGLVLAGEGGDRDRVASERLGPIKFLLRIDDDHELGL